MLPIECPGVSEVSRAGVCVCGCVVGFCCLRLSVLAFLGEQGDLVVLCGWCSVGSGAERLVGRVGGGGGRLL